MNINGAFPSDYLKAADLNGKSFSLTMGRVTVEDIGSDRRPVLHFQGAEKGLVLNKTNANSIASAFGEETDGWFGHKIEIYPSETDYQGRRVACIRVRPVRESVAPSNPAPPESNPGFPDDKGGDGNLDDEIPF